MAPDRTITDGIYEYLRGVKGTITFMVHMKNLEGTEVELTITAKDLMIEAIISGMTVPTHLLRFSAEDPCCFDKIEAAVKAC